MFVFRDIRQQVEAKDDYYPLFDWLRFALASLVCLYHEGLVGWAHAGNFAVQVFFALSGWLIGGILLRTNVHRLPHFYFNRATRIWIPYFIALAVLYGVAALREGVGQPWLTCLFYDSTFTHNWFIDPTHVMPLKGTGNHLWSISVEEQFYLAAPLMIVLLPVGRSVKFWTIVAAAAVVSQWWYGAISLGVLAAVARNRFGDWHVERRVPLAAVALVPLTMLAFVPASYALAAPFAAVGIVLLCAQSGKRNRFGEFAGGVSYPLYLYHWVGAFALAFALKHNVRVPMIAAYVVAVTAGAIAYLAVDRNVMAYRASYYSPRIGKSFMVAAYSLVVCGLVFGALDSTVRSEILFHHDKPGSASGTRAASVG